MMPSTSTSQTSKSSNNKKGNLKNPIRSSDETLFETLMTDPIKKAFLLNLLKNEKENIQKYKQQKKKDNTPTSKRKRYHCESPTALLRRKALQKNSEPESSPSTLSTATQSSSPGPRVPFDHLLEGVVAYVEIRSKDTDRSAGAKTLMRSMGATIVQRLERGVTHVVFKDGSFTTYQKAKLLKAHLVSVLWLEAVRKYSCRVSEKNYPALGTEAYDINVSDIFQEYESVVNEEYRRSLAMGSQRSQRKSRLTSLPQELEANRRKPNSTTTRRMSNIVPSSQEYELESIISSRSIKSSTTGNDSTMHAETSDDDSECGIINGRTFSQFKESLISDLESQIHGYEERTNNIENPIEINIENQSNNDCIINNRSSSVQGQTDISKNHSVSTSSSRSASLLSRKSVVTEKTINTTADMDLTGNITNNAAQERSLKRKTFHFGHESVFDNSTKKRRSVPNDNNDELPLSCVTINDTPTEVPTNSESIPSLRISEDTARSNSVKDLVVILNSCDAVLSQSKDARSQSLEKPLADGSKNTNGSSHERRKSSRFTKGTAPGERNSDSMPFSEITADNVSKCENKRKSIRIGRSCPDITSSQSTHVQDSSEELDRNKNVGNRKSTRVSKSNVELPTLKNVRVNRKSLRFSSANASESTERPNLVVASTLPNVVNSESLHINRKSSRFTRSSDALVVPSSLTDESSGNYIGESVHTTSQNSNDVSPSRLLNGGSPKSQSQILLPTVLIDKCDHYLEQTSRSNKSTEISSLRVTVDNEGLDANPKSTADVLVPVEQPLQNNKSLTRVSKNSDNISPLRISLGSEELKTSPKSKSGFVVPTEQLVQNNISLTRVSKNSGSMSPFRISADSVDSTSNQKSRADCLVPVEQPLENNESLTRVTKNSDNISPLRVSADSGDLKSKVGFLVPTEQSLKNNKPSTRISKNSDDVSPLRISADTKDVNTRRRSTRISARLQESESTSRRTTSSSKNSETMPSLRVSLESGDNTKVTRKSSRLTQSNTEKPIEPSMEKEPENSQPPAKKGKKVRKLFNLNQSTSQLQELVDEDNIVEALPAPGTNPNPKALIVALNRLVIPIKKSSKRTFRILGSSRKKPGTATQPTPSVPPTVVPSKKPRLNNNPTVVNDATQTQRTQFSELTLENVALLQSQLAPAQGSRRSTLEFIDKPKPKRTLFVKKARKSIVCTRMHKPEVKFFNEVVEKLGTFFVEDEVTEETTHLVVGEPKRTVNLLKAICRGCWILKKEWLLNSMESGKWLEEEDYELLDFSPAIKKCRIEKQAFGDFYSMDIFNDCDPIYISQNSSPKRSDLIHLIKLCKGTLEKDINKAKIVVADRIDNPDVLCVTEKWVLDSITYSKKKSFNKYLIRGRSWF